MSSTTPATAKPFISAEHRPDLLKRLADNHAMFNLQGELLCEDGVPEIWAGTGKEAKDAKEDGTGKEAKDAKEDGTGKEAKDVNENGTGKEAKDAKEDGTGKEAKDAKEDGTGKEAKDVNEKASAATDFHMRANSHLQDEYWCEHGTRRPTSLLDRKEII
jgi:type IV secretory pathway VirB10-like protein